MAEQPHDIEIDDFDDIHQLAQLLEAEVERGIVAHEDGGDPRQRRVMRGRNVQRIDIEAAPGEHPGHARQNAELVFNEDGNRVPHEVEKGIEEIVKLGDVPA